MEIAQCRSVGNRDNFCMVAEQNEEKREIDLPSNGPTTSASLAVLVGPAAIGRNRKQYANPPQLEQTPEMESPGNRALGKESRVAGLDREWSRVGDVSASARYNSLPPNAVLDEVHSAASHRRRARLPENQAVCIFLLLQMTLTRPTVNKGLFLESL